MVAPAKPPSPVIPALIGMARAGARMSPKQRLAIPQIGRAPLLTASLGFFQNGAYATSGGFLASRKTTASCLTLARAVPSSLTDRRICAYFPPPTPTRCSNQGESPCPRPTRTSPSPFYKAVIEGRVEDAFRRYAVPTYRQHNPLIEDGMEGLRKIVAWLTDARCEIKRVFADGDHVILHSHWHGLSGNPRGEAVVDI